MTRSLLATLACCRPWHMETVAPGQELAVALRRGTTILSTMPATRTITDIRVDLAALARPDLVTLLDKSALHPAITPVALTPHDTALCSHLGAGLGLTATEVATIAAALGAYGHPAADPGMVPQLAIWYRHLEARACVARYLLRQARHRPPVTPEPALLEEVHCLRCDRLLTDPESIERRLGRICLQALDHYTGAPAWLWTDRGIACIIAWARS
jgi:hypothetical protein